MSENIAVVRTFVEAIEAGEIDAAMALLDADFLMHHTTRLPYAGVYRGLDGFSTMIAGIGRFWASFEPSGRTQFVEHEGAVIVIGSLNGTARTSGARLSIPVIERCKVRDGRIVEICPFYVDHHLSAEQTV